MGNSMKMPHESSVAIETQTKKMKLLYFMIFNIFLLLLRDLNRKNDNASHEDHNQTSVISSATIDLFGLFCTSYKCTN